MNNSTNHTEIDLADVSNSVKSGFKKISDYIILFIRFIKRNFFILLALFIVGAVLGYIVDKNNKKYESKIIVQPNFGTVDFLYNKVELLDSKISQTEVSFLDSLQITPDKKVGKVEIKPIVDLYNFLNEEENHYNTFKTLSENSDASKVIEDISTSKNFKHHLITLKSGKMIEHKILENIVKFINTNDYYQLIRKDIVENLHDQIAVNDSTILQIDAILNGIPSGYGSLSNVYSTEKSQLNDLISQKLNLKKQNHELKVHLHSLDYIVSPLQYVPNLEDKTGLVGKMKFILPLLLIGAFILFSVVRKVK